MSAWDAFFWAIVAATGLFVISYLLRLVALEMRTGDMDALDAKLGVLGLSGLCGEGVKFMLAIAGIAFLVAVLK